MLVIGLSGVTCGGKTTLAGRLEAALGCTVLHQDAYFLAIDDPRHVFVPSLGHNNWELLSSMDMPQMLADARGAIALAPGQVMLVEGHTVLNYPPIAELCQLKFYLTLERAECKKRREGRVYDPADVPGYFDQVVWPEHERMKMSLPDVVWLDGTRSQDELMEEIMAAVTRWKGKNDAVS